MIKITGLLLGLLLSHSPLADEPVSNKVGTLVSLLSDPYSREYKAARQYKHIPASKNHPALTLATFTIEGYNGGNNWTQFLAVFKTVQPHDDNGSSLGKPPSYLVGYSEFSQKFGLTVNVKSAIYQDRALIFEAKTSEGKSSRFTVNVYPHHIVAQSPASQGILIEPETMNLINIELPTPQLIKPHLP